MTDNNWTADALTKILTESLKEQKRARRWKALGRVGQLFFIFFLLFIFIFSIKNGSDFSKYDVTKPHTAVIEIKGILEQDSIYANSESVIESLNKAFAQKNVKGVILDLNSPGGSPVQSDLIYNEIKKLQDNDEQKRKIYAVISDVCASGCYYIASAAEEIYANELSTVGSIGVLASRFGFVDLIKKIGVERRLQTAGKFKAFLDPFSEESEESKKILQSHLDIVHNIFIQKVKDGRGNKLKNNPDLFSGLFWTGSQSLSLGLIDGFKTKSTVAKDIIKAENIIDYTTKPTLGDLISGNVSGVSSRISLLSLYSLLNNNNINNM